MDSLFFFFISALSSGVPCSSPSRDLSRLHRPPGSVLLLLFSTVPDETILFFFFFFRLVLSPCHRAALLQGLFIYPFVFFFLFFCPLVRQRFTRQSAGVSALSSWAIPILNACLSSLASFRSYFLLPFHSLLLTWWWNHRESEGSAG